jgi:hypothetical protein
MHQLRIVQFHGQVGRLIWQLSEEQTSLGFVLAVARGSMPDRAGEYRKQAEECRRRADFARDAEAQREYLKLAEGWLKLALQVEQQQRGGSEE